MVAEHEFKIFVKYPGLLETHHKVTMRGILTCSGKTVLMTPSRMTMTSLLFKLGNWSISKSIARPALLVSLPNKITES